LCVRGRCCQRGNRWDEKSRRACNTDPAHHLAPRHVGQARRYMSRGIEEACFPELFDRQCRERLSVDISCALTQRSDYSLGCLSGLLEQYQDVCGSGVEQVDAIVPWIVYDRLIVEPVPKETRAYRRKSGHQGSQKLIALKRGTDPPSI
jgi:hypothetical protein